jgi:hypothetical protein
MDRTTGEAVVNGKTHSYHGSVYFHEQTRKELAKLKERMGVESASLLIRAAVAVLAAMPKAQVNEWLEDVSSWKNGRVK